MSWRTASAIGPQSLKLCLLLIPAVLVAGAVAAQATAQQPDAAAAGMVQRMVEHEDAASLHKQRFSYLSVERSDRTGGHEWTERVIEVPQGKLRCLLLEDGKPLSPERKQREDSRLRDIADDPQAFIRRELARKSDEQRAMEMFDLLPRAFLFRDRGRDLSWEQIEYWPNPSYEPRSYQERILHGMSGTILIDPRTLRLHMLQGKLVGNVSFGFGLLATVHSGSSLSITRNPALPAEWKTTSLDARVDGHILFFKTLDKREAFVHRDFSPVPSSLTIRQAVDFLLR